MAGDLIYQAAVAFFAAHTVVLHAGRAGLGIHLRHATASTDCALALIRRRAHWHTILSGPRKREDGAEIPAAERRRELRWMPPIPVAIEDYDTLPATVRPIR